MIRRRWVMMLGGRAVGERRRIPVFHERSTVRFCCGQVVPVAECRRQSAGDRCPGLHIEVEPEPANIEIGDIPLVPKLKTRSSPRRKARTRSPSCGAYDGPMHGRIDQAEKRVIRIVDYDPSWPTRFSEIGAALRQALRDVALRIDHIGSTSVPGLAAKAIIDIQISVIRLEPVGPFRDRLRDLGLVYRADNPERTKRYFREAPGQPRTHVHVRRAGSFSEQFPLLFRDFLRVDRRAAADYVSAKRDLARLHPLDGQAYTDAKAGICWEIMQRADEWAQQNGWEPGPSDA
jgi:GrpB-like predicted nucleotidyltransferase (UPF0157 family)